MGLPDAASLTHLPPECIENPKDIHKYSPAFDIYSFGITLYEIFADKQTYDDMNDPMIMVRVKNGCRPDIRELTGRYPTVTDLMQRCWVKTAEERPSAGEVMRVLQNVYNEEMEARALREAMECVKFVELKRGAGEGETFSMFTQRVTGNVQHDGGSSQRVNGQPYANIQHVETIYIGCPNRVSTGVSGPQIQFKHLSYDEAKVQLDLHHEGIHLPNENAEVNTEQLRQIGNLLATDFKKLGRCLLFKDAELDTIEHDKRHEGLTEQNQKMLHDWKLKYAELASRKWLATACLSLQRRDLIDILVRG